MTRCFGMMPSDEIEKSCTYREQFGLKIGVDAGPHGWTIRWADSSCSYKDVDATTEENFNAAIEEVKSHGFELTPCNDETAEEA